MASDATTPDLNRLADQLQDVADTVSLAKDEARGGLEEIASALEAWQESQDADMLLDGLEACRAALQAIVDAL